MNNSKIYKLICSTAIFLLGMIYLSFPTYYGLLEMSKIETGNLFISFIIIYSLLNLAIYFINRDENEDNLVISIMTLITCFISYFLPYFMNSFLVVPISIMILLFLITSYKVVKIFKMKEEKDNYYQVEKLLIIILNCFGIILSFNMLNDYVLQTIMLGFIISVFGMYDFVNVCFREVMHNKSFVKGIK